MTCYPYPRARDLMVILAGLWSAWCIWKGPGRWQAGEDLLLVGCIPLWLHLCRPWNWLHREDHSWLPCSLLFLGLGWAAFQDWPMIGKVLAWNLIVWLYLYRQVPLPSRMRASRLFLLPVLGFPWIASDLAPYIWHLRLFNACALEWMYRALGVITTRQDTTVWTPVCSFSVIDECAGLHTLQTMAIAGTLLAFHYARTDRGFWQLWPRVVVLAVLTNTLRILMIGLVGLGWGTEYTEGPAHTLLGWAVMLLALYLTLAPGRKLESEWPLELERF